MMSPKDQERLFDRSYAHELLRIAGQDHKTAAFAAHGIASGDVRAENVLFLYQQSIEKLLKAVLCHLQVPVPLVRDLGVLVAKLPPDVQPEVGYEVMVLNDFAGVRRYEDGGMAFTAEDVEEARGLSQKLLDWAGSVIAGEAALCASVP